MPTLDSLRVILNTTKLQQTDPRLYQFLNSLLADTSAMQGSVNNISAEIENITNNITNIMTGEEQNFASIFMLGD